jgi:retron-type reverse transcriptase
LVASLQTPERIRTLQRKLYLKAKAEPAFRFYLLYDKIHRADILRHAYALARSNGGAPGVDGITFARIEAAGLEEWLAGLREDLVAKTYRPAPVRRVMITKPGGGERPLGIPTIRDRVVQTAAKLVLEPIFEADFEDSAYGYRPGRSGADAIKDVHRHICRGYTDVVDADLSKYFDTIPHPELMQSVARRIVDRHVLWLIKLWLKAPIEERDGEGKPRMNGGKGSTRGTPQGGVASPLLSIIYMNRFLKHWRLTGRGEAFRAHVISYADDVRHITRRWIPFAERRGLEDMTPGPTAYPAAKAKGDRSMPSKRERSEDADDPVPQGPRDTVRTELFEPQPPTMQAYIPRHSVLRRGHRDRATKSSSLEPSTRWAMGHRPIQGGERGTYVALDTSSTTGMWDRPTRREAQGDGAAVVLRGRESRPHGEGR